MTKRGCLVKVHRARKVRALNKHVYTYSDLFPGWQVADKIAKPHKLQHQLTEKAVTENENFQPEIESNEYSSTRGNPSDKSSIKCGSRF